MGQCANRAFHSNKLYFKSVPFIAFDVEIEIDLDFVTCFNKMNEWFS